MGLPRPLRSFFVMKALSSGCADCVLARKDVQTFDNQADMSKEAVRPDCECRRGGGAIFVFPHHPLVGW